MQEGVLGTLMSMLMAQGLGSVKVSCKVNVAGTEAREMAKHLALIVPNPSLFSAVHVPASLHLIFYSSPFWYQSCGLVPAQKDA